MGDKTRLIVYWSLLSWLCLCIICDGFLERQRRWAGSKIQRKNPHSEPRARASCLILALLDATSSGCLPTTWRTKMFPRSPWAPWHGIGLKRCTLLRWGIPVEHEAPTTISKKRSAGKNKTTWRKGKYSRLWPQLLHYLYPRLFKPESSLRWAQLREHALLIFNFSASFQTYTPASTCISKLPPAFMHSLHQLQPFLSKSHLSHTIFTI